VDAHYGQKAKPVGHWLCKSAYKGRQKFQYIVEEAVFGPPDTFLRLESFDME